MEFEPQFIMETEGMTMEEGPIVMFTDDVMMEEIYEETEELVATFLPMMPEEDEGFAQEKPLMMTNTFQEEEMIEETPMIIESFPEEEIIEEKPAMMTESFPQEEMMEEEIIEEDMLEEPTEMVEEEMIEEEPTEMAEEESVEEKPTKMVQAKDEKKKETIKEKKPTSETTKKSAIQTKKIVKQKEIQQKKALVKIIARVMEKVDNDIKNIIKLKAMTSQQESLDKYQATSFYEPKNIYLDQLNLIDNRLIYADKSLATYIQNDKIDIKTKKLQEIKSKKQQILLELEVLKNG